MKCVYGSTRILTPFGRKIPCSIGFLLVSIAFILLACLTKQIALSAVNHIAKLLVAGTYSIVWFLVPELFPTNHRNFGLGFSNALSKIFGILSPFIANQVGHDLPKLGCRCKTVFVLIKNLEGFAVFSSLSVSIIFVPVI
ncbi:hypothetical protein GJ496_009614 [Pomphorhynchus laevis]|nr:hypothetical protein GJ496_009614 [Pomphorhynchus laevis]